MKTTNFIICVAIATVSMSFTRPDRIVTSPENRAVVSAANPFDAVRLHREGKGITVVWSMSTFDDVTGLVIQRTYEDPTDPYAYWEDLATLPCAAARSFKYKDKEVFPGMIHYRIVAVMTDGQTITSEISGIRIRSRH